MTKFQCSRCSNMLLKEMDVNLEGKKVLVRVPVYLLCWEDLADHYDKEHPEWTQIVASRILELSQ
jgi:hypothetical protein